MTSWIRRQSAAVEDHIYRLIMADSTSAYRVAFGALVVLMFVTSSLLFLTGAAPQRNAPCDAVNLLDGGWRIVSGLIPHVDYYDHLNLTSHLSVLVGMAIGGCTSSALAYGPAALLPLLSFWGWTLARRRFPAFPAFWIASLIGGLTAGAFPLGVGLDWRHSSYEMQYNRFQWSLLCLLALLLLVEPLQALGRRAKILEGAGAGLLLGLLLLGKLNYTLAGIIVLGAGVVLARFTKNRFWSWPACAATCFALLAAAFVYFRGDFASYWRDLTWVVGVQQFDSRVSYIAKVFSNSTPELWTFCFAIFLFLRQIFAEDQTLSKLRTFLTGFLVATLLMLLGTFVTIGNAQAYDIPLWVLASAIIAEYLRRQFGERGGDSEQATGRPESARLRLLLAYMAAGIMALSFSAADFGSVAYAFAWKHFRSANMPADAQINTPTLTGMFIPPDTYDLEEIKNTRATMLSVPAHPLSPYEYSIYVNTGLELLRGRVDENSRIFTLDWVNPFPYALHLRDPSGAPLAWHDHRIVDDSHHPSVADVFKDVTHVMVPRISIWEHQELLLVRRVCGDYIKEHYVPVAKSDMWTLMVRKPGDKNRDAAP